MNFGQALEAVKQGMVAFRQGWNGKGMFIYLKEGSTAVSPEHRGELIEGVKSDLFQYGDTGTITRLPNLNMKAATGSTVTGWLASQADLLAEDWEVKDLSEPHRP